MWDSITKILTSSNAWSVLAVIAFIFVILCLMVKSGMIVIKTKGLQIGGESQEAYFERKIVQEQADFTHTYLMGLIGKITDVCPDHQLIHDGWMTKCILEYVYDEFVNWIHYNHISADDAYVSVKQNKICSLIYSQPVRPEFKTSEFQNRMKNWVKEIIVELVRIRKVYMSQMK